MPFLGDKLPTMKLTFPNGTVRWVQVLPGESATPVLTKIIAEEGARFLRDQVVTMEIVNDKEQTPIHDPGELRGDGDGWG